MRMINNQNKKPSQANPVDFAKELLESGKISEFIMGVMTSLEFLSHPDHESILMDLGSLNRGSEEFMFLAAKVIAASVTSMEKIPEAYLYNRKEVASMYANEYGQFRGDNSSLKYMTASEVLN